VNNVYNSHLFSVFGFSVTILYTLILPKLQLRAHDVTKLEYVVATYYTMRFHLHAF